MAISPSADILASLKRQEQGGHLLLMGKTGGGKTELVKHIVRRGVREGRWHDVIVVAPTAEFSSDYTFTQPGRVFTRASEELLRGIMRVQKTQWQLTHRRVLLILDDIIGHVRIHNSAVFDEVATSGRHFGIQLVILTQDMFKVSTVVRQNTAHLFAVDSQPHQLKAAFEMGTGFARLPDFTTAVRACWKRKGDVVRFDLQAGGLPPSTANLGMCRPFKLT